MNLQVGNNLAGEIKEQLEPVFLRLQVEIGGLAYMGCIFHRLPVLKP